MVVDVPKLGCIGPHHSGNVRSPKWNMIASRQHWKEAFSTLKTELHPATWSTRAQARAAIADYIERFYNCGRLHSTLRYQSPAAFEARFKVAV